MTVAVTVTFGARFRPHSLAASRQVSVVCCNFRLEVESEAEKADLDRERVETVQLCMETLIVVSAEILVSHRVQAIAVWWETTLDDSSPVDFCCGDEIAAVTDCVDEQLERWSVGCTNLYLLVVAHPFEQMAPGCL